MGVVKQGRSLVHVHSVILLCKLTEGNVSPNAMGPCSICKVRLRLFPENSQQQYSEDILDPL